MAILVDGFRRVGKAKRAHRPIRVGTALARLSPPYEIAAIVWGAR